MTSYSFNPAGVNTRRVKGLVESLGGSAQVVQPTRSDGTPGVAMLVVEMPDDVTGEQVQGIVTAATGVTDADQMAWERQRKRQAAKAALRDTDDRVLIAVRNTQKVVFQSLVETRTAFNQLRSQLIAAGLPLTVPALINRTWEQALAVVEQQIDAEVP